MNPLVEAKNLVKPELFAKLALVYLALPNLIFLLTWVRPAIGIPAAIITGVGLTQILRLRGQIEKSPGLTKQNLTFVLIIAFLWTLVAGAGGFVPQGSDYQKHNLIFHDLVQQPWPTIYHTGTNENYLCYCLGYYLVPTLISRFFGETWLPALTFLWAFAGVALFFYWVSTFGRSVQKTLLIFLLFATTETVWHLFFHLLKNPAIFGNNNISQRLLDLGLTADYTDNFVSFQFRPQHIMASWLGTALLYELLWVRKNPRSAGFVWALCLLWSPLASLGLLLVPLAALKRVPWQNYFSAVNLVGGGILLAVMGIYFQGHLPMDVNGPIWKFSAKNDWLVFYPLFLVMQLVPVLLVYLADRKYNFLGELRPLFLASAILLLLLPLYKMGFNNDLRLQVSTVALLFIALAASRGFQSDSFTIKRPLFSLLVASQIFGIAYPFARWWQEAFQQKENFSYVAMQARGISDVSELKLDGMDYSGQYLGRPDSVAARWLLR
jgi:hypothetical protein